MAEMTWQQQRKLDARRYRRLCSFLVLTKNDDGTTKYPNVYNEWVEYYMEVYGDE